MFDLVKSALHRIASHRAAGAPTGARTRGGPGRRRRPAPAAARGQRRAARRPAGSYIDAMDKDGHIYAAPATEVKHHSAFFAGRPGAAFGCVSVRDGEIQHLNDESGHYLPPSDYGRQMLHQLKARGVKVPADKVKLHFSKADLAKARKKGRPLNTERLVPDLAHVKMKKY